VSSLSPKPVTLLLAQWNAGNDEALHAALPQVYDELRRLAGHYMRGERPDHTLQGTALVHEAYLRLEKQGAVRFNDRSHFVAICAQLMRQILVEHARTHRAAKRNGGIKLTLDDALTELAKLDAQQCKIVELRFFGGLSIEESAQALGLSPATVKRHWATARLWLHQQMKAEDA
jgi:DNA-directed RNA polymerase specialized sigma24 family protein